MIPRIIHYCWFGGGQMPPLAIKCINSWEKYLPEYKLMLWNEKTFDVTCCKYVAQAYESRKFAFVTDYVRLWALYEYGGVYMDTDVEVLRPLDDFLKHEAFSGFEDGELIPTGIMAAKRRHPWIGMLLEDYTDLDFIKQDGSFDLTTNVVRITRRTMQYSPFKQDDTFQELKDGLAIYPKRIFCPKSYDTGRIALSRDTATIHHFSSSWHTEEERKQHRIQKTLRNAFGDAIGWKLYGAYKSLKERRFIRTLFEEISKRPNSKIK